MFAYLLLPAKRMPVLFQFSPLRVVLEPCHYVVVLVLGLELLPHLLFSVAMQRIGVVVLVVVVVQVVVVIEFISPSNKFYLRLIRLPRLLRHGHFFMFILLDLQKFSTQHSALSTVLVLFCSDSHLEDCSAQQRLRVQWRCTCV